MYQETDRDRHLRLSGKIFSYSFEYIIHGPNGLSVYKETYRSN